MAGIATLLATARRQAGLTQRELSDAADVPQSSISRIERGLISPRASTIERWLAACGRSLALSPIGAGMPAEPVRTQPQESPPILIEEDEPEQPSDWASWMS